MKKQLLELDRTYIVDSNTPLMPEPRPKNPLKALSRMKYLHPGDYFFVSSRKKVGSRRWYGVGACRSDGELIGMGYIKDVALLGQNLRCKECGTINDDHHSAQCVDEHEKAKSCDNCACQEGSHYCLLHSEQIKNMNLHCCEDWQPYSTNKG